MHGRSHTTIDPRILTMPGRSMGRGVIKKWLKNDAQRENFLLLVLLPRLRQDVGQRDTLKPPKKTGGEAAFCTRYFSTVFTTVSCLGYGGGEGTRYHARPKPCDHRPSHPYNAGTEHAELSPTRPGWGQREVHPPQKEVVRFFEK